MRAVPRDAVKAPVEALVGVRVGHAHEGAREGTRPDDRVLRDWYADFTDIDAAGARARHASVEVAGRKRPVGEEKRASIRSHKLCGVQKEPGHCRQKVALNTNVSSDLEEAQGLQNEGAAAGRTRARATGDQRPTRALLASDLGSMGTGGGGSAAGTSLLRRSSDAVTRPPRIPKAPIANDRESIAGQF